jgi:uncharacterized repeat protein (TIGR03806 family)
MRLPNDPTLRALAMLLLVVGTAEACDDDVEATRLAASDDGGAASDATLPPAPTRAPFGLDARPANATCLAPPRPTLDTGVKLVPAFPGLTFTIPMKLVQAPGDASRFFVVERGSGTGNVPAKIRVFPANATSMADVKDFATVMVNPLGEGGFLSMAFHPNWAANHTVFLSYTRSFDAATDTIPNKLDGKPEPSSGMTSVIAKATSSDGVAPLGTPVEILRRSQPFSNHNGGDLAFGPDGYLYFAFGDGGSGNDPFGGAQNLGSWLGKMLRLDVDGASPYAIPPTNPFVNAGANVQKEIYAYGFRNPWRWSFDRATGDLWVGDVGQNTFEEIDRVEAGGNYGWNVCEGFHKRGDTTNLCDTPGLLDPIVEHGRTEAFSITGGYVYRGKAIPDLVGTYVYADFGTGNVFGIFYDGAGKATSKILAKGANINAFGQDHDGEIYVVQIGGTILKLAPATTPAPATFPDALSKTGCVDPADPKRPASGLVPYGVRSPLWSDGAEKERYMALPDGATIAGGADGDFSFPKGTVLMKTFSLAGKRVETRLFVRHDDGQWAGYSYEWNDAQTDATLLPAGKVRDLGGGVSWTYPSRSQCLQCHTEAAGGSLGLELAQQNGDYVYASTNRVSNQLATLEHLGLFDAPLGDPSALPALAEPFAGAGAGAGAGATLEDRARSYLHSNCSHCHRPGGNGKGSMDLRSATPFAATGTCNGEPEEGTFGVDAAKIVAPGDPSKSILSMRFHATDARRMPPVGVKVTDGPAAALLDEWITSVKTCP